MNELLLKKAGQRNRVLDAKDNFDKIMEDIKPFVKKKKMSIPQATKWEISHS